jgi:galactokinase
VPRRRGPQGRAETPLRGVVSGAVRTFRAPGRVNLIGEHTDYAGGLVLPAAIDRAVTVTGEPAEVIRLRSGRDPRPVEVRADGGGSATGWGRYVAAVAAELDALGRPPVGFAGRVASDLPSGSGLASSAALEVAVACALCGTAEFAVEPLELADACRRAEERAVGVPCGVMDQAASLLGRAGHALLLDCSTLEHRHVPIPAELALVVIHSGVERTLASSAYAQRRAEVEAGDERRLRHVRSENERVLAVADALEADDRPALGRLFRAGHESLRDDFEVSTPELDLLVDLAYDEGVVGARLTGAGFGGAILALAEISDAEALGVRVASRYRPRSGLEAQVLVCHAAEGAA